MSIFKAYDIRGIYGQDLNEDIFYRIARAYAQFCGFTGKAKVVVARDCRTSSDSLFAWAHSGLYLDYSHLAKELSAYVR